MVGAWPGCAGGGERGGQGQFPRHPCAQPRLSALGPSRRCCLPLPAPHLGLTLGSSLNVSSLLNLSCLTHRGGWGGGLGELGLNHGSWGKRYKYRSDYLVVEPSSLPDLGHTGTFDREEPWGWQGGACRRLWPPQVPAPPLLLASAASRWLGRDSRPSELEGAVPVLGPLPGGLAGSCLWVWSVRTPCFKGSGWELASEASPRLIKNFFLFLNHHVFISHWNKVSF